MTKIAHWKFLKFWFPVLLYSAIIFFVSSLPGVRVATETISDKFIHILEYGIFGLLLTRAFGSTSLNWSKSSVIFVVLLISCLYGLSDEFHQMFVPGREAEVGDVMADSLGGFLGSIIYILKKK